MNTSKHVCVIGLGYIGLPTAALLASAGARVTGVDIDAGVVDTINQSRIHIVEPGLAEHVSSNVDAGRLVARTKPVAADCYMIAVPTPFDAERKPDVSFVMAAGRSIAPHLAPGAVVILESTSPVGTTEALSQTLAQARPDLEFAGVNGTGRATDVHVCYCPERVIPGKALFELVANDRVIGGMSDAGARAAADVYRLFVEGELTLTSARTAELCKLTENAYRDTNIAFANEMANVCEVLDIDVWELIALANHHPRVNILKPGPGVGGHCIAVDPWFIVDSAPGDTPLITASRNVNDGRPQRVVDKVEAWLAGSPSDAKVAVFGLAFKPNVDDLRQSPALDIAARLAQRSGSLLVVEPHIQALPKALGDGGAQLVSAREAIAAADLGVVLVDHDAYRDDVTKARDKLSWIDVPGSQQLYL